MDQADASLSLPSITRSVMPIHARRLGRGRVARAELNRKAWALCSDPPPGPDPIPRQRGPHVVDGGPLLEHGLGRSGGCVAASSRLAGGFTRLTNGFSKKVDNLKANVALHLHALQFRTHP
jgi:hypothetical protein